MLTFKPIWFKIANEKLLSCKQFVRLFETNRSDIISAKFILPKLGSRTVGGYLQVKLRTRQQAAIEQYNEELKKQKYR